MNRTPLAPRVVAMGILLPCMLAGAPATPEDLAWRSDYNSVRREAKEKNRPIILVFTTENCFWCNKLETTTFHDAAVLKLVNERFIPIRLNAQQNPQLTEALRIQSFPTLILAAPGGKIVGTLEGFVEAPRFIVHLQHALDLLNEPEWMLRDFREASNSANDPARAVALLKGILEDGQDRPVQAQARRLLDSLEQQAADSLAKAKQQVNNGQSDEAVSALSELQHTYAGTRAAAEAAQIADTLALKPEVKAEQRSKRARELMAQAREDYRTQQYLCCIDRCEVLAASYADLPEGAQAAQLVADIKSNPQWLQQACENLSDRLGLLYLCLAEAWLKKGQPQEAVVYLERVIQAFPGSHQAEIAQARLSQIQGQPTKHADFKK
jgi:thioredoxin-related protein